MIALDSVNADVCELWNVETGNSVAYHSNLIAIRYNDANRLLCVEVVAILPIDATQQVCDDIRLVEVYLISRCLGVLRVRW